VLAMEFVSELALAWKPRSTPSHPTRAGAPVGLGATLIVAMLIVRHAGGPRPTMMSICLRYSTPGSKLINMIAFTNLQQFSETIGNCDKSVCLHAKIQQV